MQKEEQLAQEAVISAKADKLLAQEEVWIRKGVEARRTRSVARIGRLEALRASRAARRDALGSVKLDVASGEQSGKIVAELTDVSKSFGHPGGESIIVNDFTATILRGDKVGLIGPNGAGKTTLLKLILGELQPGQPPARSARAPTCRWPTSTRCATRWTWTPRWRTSSAPAASGSRSAASASTSRATWATSCSRPARANSPVRSLSGGERNRLLLARLFARPANVLVLDEPTNDLDIDTLELLEDLLQDYDGTVFLVSHDRAFLDNVVTSTIAFEGDGLLARVRRRREGLADAVKRAAQTRRRAQARRSPSSAKTSGKNTPAAQ